MGLFSGSFGSGLVTGLATSVDKSLQDAMEKRDEEVSRARQFWMTRQAQKMDLADEHDAKAEDLLNRMIDEFGGDVAKALAAYKGAGNNVESVSQFFADMDETSRLTGVKQNISERVAFDNINLEDYADLSREDALGSIRMELKPVDIQMQDTGLLANIGLGARDLGATASAEINKLIPPRQKKAFNDLIGATIDTSSTVASTQYRNQVLNEIPQLEQQFNIITSTLSRGVDPVTNQPLTAEQEIKLREDLDNVTNNIAKYNAAIKDDKFDYQQWQFHRSNYKDGLTTVDSNISYNDRGPQPTVIANGETLVGPEAVEFRKQKHDEYNASFFTDNLIDAQGNYVNKEAQNFAETNGLDIYMPTEQEQVDAEATGGVVGTGTDMDVMAGVPDEDKNAKVREAYPNPLDFANKTASKASSPEDIFNALNIIYPKVDAAELSVIAENAFANKPEPETPEPPREFTPSGPEITIDDAGRKTADGVTWNPNETPTMVDVARNENVDMTIRKAAFEDLILKTNMDEATQERLASEYGLE